MAFGLLTGTIAASAFVAFLLQNSPIASKLGPALAFVGVLSFLYDRTFKSTPDASEQELQNDGASVLRLADKRIVEYFQYGSPSGIPLIFFHGYTLSGSVASSWDEVSKRNEIRVISISMAGWGGSSPQRGRSYRDAGEDALAVLRHLRLESTPLHIVGVSFGAGNAAAFALLLPADRILSVSLIIPAWPSMADHDMWLNTPMVHKLTGKPVLDRFWQYYIAPKLDIPSLLKKLAPKDWADFVAKNPNAVEGMTKELRRSTKWHLEGACDGMRLLRGGGTPIYEKRADLQALGPRVVVWYAQHDTLAPAHHGQYLAKLLPSARVHPVSGGHLSMFNDLQPFIDEMKQTHQS